MKLIGLFLTLLGAVSVYCCHSNQNLLSQHLPTLFKYLGLLFLIIGLIALFASLPKVVAAFCWFMLLIFAWSFLPFMALFKRKLVS
ncbi:hypothetical protein BUM88_09510 [Acinetobacter calcoaceticus]|nr:hypothetical protein BUM88_09510 [Acinetobacter calcoaceticus]